jgi:hypothetical protein
VALVAVVPAAAGLPVMSWTTKYLSNLFVRT